jgi:hypothetical protein
MGTKCAVLIANTITSGPFGPQITITNIAPHLLLPLLQQLLLLQQLPLLLLNNRTGILNIGIYIFRIIQKTKYYLHVEIHSL